MTSSHTRKTRRCRCLEHFLCIALALTSGGACSATFNVTTSADSGSGSLRDTVTLANANTGADQITFDAGLGTITLTSGQIDVTDTLIITGPETGQTISGNNASRIFAVTTDSAPLTLEHLALTAAHTTGDGGLVVPTTPDPGDSPPSVPGAVLPSDADDPPPPNPAPEPGDPPPSPDPGDPPPSDPPPGEHTCTADTGEGGAICSLSDLSLIDSEVTNSGTEGHSAHGGGLFAQGAFTLIRSTVASNSTTGSSATGGGLYAGGTAALSDSRVSANSTAGTSASGGGLYIAGSLAMDNSTAADNTTAGADAGGGGIHVTGSATLTNSTLSGNSVSGDASDGGGLEIALGFGEVTLTNCTVSGNRAEGTDSRGGGLSIVDTETTLNNSTVTDNTSTTGGGGVDFYETTMNGPLGLTLISTILAGNGGPDGNFHLETDSEFGGTSSVTVSASYTLFGDPATEINGTDADNVFSDAPDLSTLADSGCAAPAGAPDSAGCVPTHSPNANSPAVDSGANPLALTADQRGSGFPRTLGGQTDIGAFETPDTPTPLIGLSPDPLDFPDTRVGTTSAAMAVTLSNPGTADLHVTGISTAAAPFSRSGGTCGTASFTVTAGTTCTLGYTFAPTLTGTATQTIGVTSDAPSGSDQDFDLQGTGTDADSDGDGVDATTENGAPNGGDGNYDGTPDADQANVTSLPAGDGGGYLTLVVGGGCPAAYNVASLSAAALDPDPSGRSYPYGLLAFELPCTDAEVTVYYHGVTSLPGADYGKFGPTPDTEPPFDPGQASWYRLPGVTFGSEPLGGPGGPLTAYARFTLTNGGWGDDTGTGDGTIVDQGGPGLPPANAAVPALSEWGRWLLVATLLTFGGLRLRRSTGA